MVCSIGRDSQLETHDVPLVWDHVFIIPNYPIKRPRNIIISHGVNHVKGFKSNVGTLRRLMTSQGRKNSSVKRGYTSAATFLNPWSPLLSNKVRTPLYNLRLTRSFCSTKFAGSNTLPLSLPKYLACLGLSLHPMVLEEVES